MKSLTVYPDGTVDVTLTREEMSALVKVLRGTQNMRVCRHALAEFRTSLFDAEYLVSNLEMLRENFPESAGTEHDGAVEAMEFDRL